MDKIALVLILMFLVVAGVLGVTVGDTAVNRHYDHIEQPPSAMQQVLASRQTPVTEQENGRWLYALVPLALLAAVGAAIGLMAYGERLMKEWRRMRRKSSAAAAYAAYAPQLAPGQPNADWQQVPTARQLPMPTPTYPESRYESN